MSSSPFRWRGVIEGYYGPPWSHEAREAQFAWMSAHGLNTYVYAPKDDPYQRANWREPYPADKAAALLHEVRAAAGAGVAWVPNVSPALALIPGRPAAGTMPSRPICFACPGDLDVLVAKLAPFVDAGAAAVAVSFDDVLPISPYPQDWRAYGIGSAAAARMQKDLLGRLHERLGVPIVTVLTEYAGMRDSPYLQAIRAEPRLDPAIEIAWTGTAVISARIDAGDAAAYAALVGRDRVLVWDNHPAHDVTGPSIGLPPSRLFLGSYEGRDPGLGAVATGVVANPMQLPLASRIPLATMAEYLADPPAYDPAAAWERALSDAGGDPAAALAENSRSSRLDRTESVAYSAAVEGFATGLGDGTWPARRAELDSELARESGARASLTALNPGLATEVEPWLRTLTANADVTARAADLAESMLPRVSASAVADGAGGTEVTGRVAPARPREAAVGLGWLVSAWAAARLLPAVTHGDRFTYLIDALYVGENRVDRFVASTAARVLVRLLPVLAAGSRLRVTVGGTQVPVAADGTFRAASAAAGPVEVVAVDGAGGATRVAVSP